MGAASFEHKATGADVHDAFRNARTAACFDHGHAGYTGTIAEKSRIRLIDVDYAAERLLKAYDELLRDTTVAAQKKLRAARASLAGRYDEASQRQLLQVEGRIASQWQGESLAFACKRQRTTIQTMRRALRAKRGRAAAVASAINHLSRLRTRDADLNSILDSYDDKWGPALAVQLRKGEWLFFGTASC